MRAARRWRVATWRRKRRNQAIPGKEGPASTTERSASSSVKDSACASASCATVSSGLLTLTAERGAHPFSLRTASCGSAVVTGSPQLLAAPLSARGTLQRGEDGERLPSTRGTGKPAPPYWVACIHTGVAGFCCSGGKNCAGRLLQSVSHATLMPPRLLLRDRSPGRLLRQQWKRHTMQGLRPRTPRCSERRRQMCWRLRLRCGAG